MIFYSYLGQHHAFSSAQWTSLQCCSGERLHRIRPDQQILNQQLRLKTSSSMQLFAHRLLRKIVYTRTRGTAPLKPLFRSRFACSSKVVVAHLNSTLLQSSSILRALLLGEISGQAEFFPTFSPLLTVQGRFSPRAVVAASLPSKSRSGGVPLHLCQLKRFCLSRRTSSGSPGCLRCVVIALEPRGRSNC